MREREHPLQVLHLLRDRRPRRRCEPSRDVTVHHVVGDIPRLHPTEVEPEMRETVLLDVLGAPSPVRPEVGDEHRLQLLVGCPTTIWNETTDCLDSDHLREEVFRLFLVPGPSGLRLLPRHADPPHSAPLVDRPHAGRSPEWLLRSFHRSLLCVHRAPSSDFTICTSATQSTTRSIKQPTRCTHGGFLSPLP